ncbi:hypothetical protein ACFL1I_08190 [Candidatus Omnitrophota bacterium]
MRIFKSKIFWGLSIIFLGAIGTGVWEHLLKPVCLYCTEIILTITTFGVEKFKNDIYIEVSKGFFERPSIRLFLMFVGVIIGLIAGMLTERKAKDTILSTGKRRTIFMKFAITYFLVVGIWLMVSGVRMSYVNRAIANFKQLHAIISPYTPDKEQKVYISRFSQIRSKNDYSNLISELQSITTKNGQIIPEFKIW